MPLVSLSTNAKLDSEDAKKAFISNFSKRIDKEEEYLNVGVAFDPYLLFGGTFEPAVMLKIISLDTVTPANSQVWSKEFSTYFEKNLGVPTDRGLMQIVIC